MKKLFRLLILAIIAFICITAYTDSRENGKSFWYNTGNRIKTSAMYVFNHSREALSDVDKGLKK
jgi:hypothetical protein